MRGFHRGDALSPVSDAAVQRTGCPRVKVIVLMRSGWTLGTERQAGVSPTPTRDRWRELAEQPCESMTLFRARLREWLPAVSRSAN